MYIGGLHFDDLSVGTFLTYNTNTLDGGAVYEDAISCISSLDIATPCYPPIYSPPPAMPSCHKPASPASSARQTVDRKSHCRTVHKKDFGDSAEERQ